MADDMSRHVSHMRLVPGLRCEYEWEQRERYPPRKPMPPRKPIVPMPSLREQLRGPGPHPWWRRAWWFLTDVDLS
jgi:hypothetical protein